MSVVFPAPAMPTTMHAVGLSLIGLAGEDAEAAAAGEQAVPENSDTGGMGAEGSSAAPLGGSGGELDDMVSLASFYT